ncbi:MAG: 23S rRNA (adenine(2030)-N(6))-methyltransferase RlmJ [Pseudomonadota bacterium]|nr:23S rRNA (adenine(2030)-N(6))-methyltransferase RlmJ [Pseudomonadota bacterium]
MLSYQHGFHAGNFADVHKHVIWGWILAYLKQKPKPITVMDVYAGAGKYDLRSESAQKTGEFHEGVERFIKKLKESAEASSSFEGYLSSLKKINPQWPELSAYPGSPALAYEALDGDDRLILCELHPAEFTKLRKAFPQQGRRHQPAEATRVPVTFHQRDALEALVALCPPKIRRGAVLIDPSYEVKSEYAQVAAAVVKAYEKWPQGTYMIWYPILREGRHKKMVKQLQQLIESLVVHEFSPATPVRQGMQGSGAVVINPPYLLEDQLTQLRPF